MSINPEEVKEMVDAIGIENLDRVAEAIWHEFSWPHSEWGRGAFEVLECRRAATAAITAFEAAKTNVPVENVEIARASKSTISHIERILELHRATENKIFGGKP